MKILTHDQYRARSERKRPYWATRFILIVGATLTLFFLRLVDPVVAGSWIPIQTSCGAITGMPCILCGMTRALHSLLNGNFGDALYFNWLAFPFLAAIIFLIAVCLIEIATRRAIVRWNPSAPFTARNLTTIGVALLLLWALQIYLAVSQHKYELLNPRGPLYALFVR